MISTNPIFSISFKNRQIIAFYNHWICSFCLTGNKVHFDDSLIVKKINYDNLDECNGQKDFYVGRMKGYLENQSMYTEGFLFYKNDEPAGFVWVMYPGGNEFQYKVRKTDAFIFDVSVFEKFRGEGICGKMLLYLFNYLEIEKNAKEVKLAVRKNNVNAIRAYKKAGGVFVRSCRFFQIARRFNIPYYTV